ncbi:hypothetical protein [Chondromyces crocatus]|uniref:Uncharacterized protein n=1 Tax=Chondromyces crocatus TaxID=52 RepID=A0A0K1EPL6_CHOCO|nr:hypothetical protein [Chondromyces crocatus]AKT42582.1 uncharacterized protein CMC5_068090 [Chondromyces crocatus]
MGQNELGQLLDPSALDRAEGARGRLRLVVPAQWDGEPTELEITAPLRITCARCDGGGCDACGRSGALKTPDDPADRILRVQLPAQLGGGVVLRLVRPFGDTWPIEQLLLELVPGATPSRDIVRLPPPAPLAPWTASPPSSHARATALGVGFLAVLAAVLALLASR